MQTFITDIGHYAQQIKNSRDVAPSTANRRVIALKFLTEEDYIAAESVRQEGLKTKKIQGGLQANVKWLKEDEVNTYCKRLADNTGQIQVVADLAGHSNINTTRIYVKPSKEELKKYVNDVEL